MIGSLWVYHWYIVYQTTDYSWPISIVQHERKMKYRNVHYNDEIREMTINMFLAGKSEFEISNAIKKRVRDNEWNSKRRRRRGPTNFMRSGERREKMPV